MTDFLENLDTRSHLEKLANRTLTIKPHKKSYQHREVLCVFVTIKGKVVECLAVNEYGDKIENLANHLLVHPKSYVITTNDPAWLASYMLKRFEHLECFQMKLTETRKEDEVGEVKANLSRVGFTNGRKAQQSGRHKALHMVWPSNSYPDGLFTENFGAAELLKAAIDIRDYCKEQAIAIPNQPKGIAGDFLRDERFWPEHRGKVPGFINDDLRAFIPGNHMELRGTTREVMNVWSIDMRNAYHKIVQEINVPDHTHMYGRGYTRSWRTAPIWFASKTPEFEREINRYGLVIVEAVSRPTRKNEWRPKVINFSGKKRIALWTNEIPFCTEMGLDIHGLIAGWTSNHPDTGIGKYGKFAFTEASNSDVYRRKWLKPTLHTLYGMFASNKKSIRIGHLRGNGKQRLRFTLGFGNSIEVSAFEVPSRVPATTHVAILGSIQAELRVRMLRLANELEASGHPVTHVHADGLHIATENLPFFDDNWKIEQRSELVYIDDVSWIWANGECLPGRPELEKQRELRRYDDMINAGVYGYRKAFNEAA